MKDKHFQKVPAEVKSAIMQVEVERLGLSLEELDCSASWGMVKGYMTDSPGWCGDVVIVLWPADPGAVSVYGRRAPLLKWEFLRQTTW